MARILIITDAHTPPLYGVRARSFAQHLAQQGHDVELISEYYHDNKTQLTNLKYKYLQLPIYGKNSVMAFLVRTAVWLIDILFPLKEKLFTNAIRKNISGKTYDAILCSTFNSFPLLTAHTIAQEVNAKLIVDIRDMAEQAPGFVYHQYHHRILTPLLKLKQRRETQRRNQVLRQADAITTVSPWHLEQLKDYNTNIHLIYNGYDADSVVPRAKKQENFNIVYLGKYYGKPLQNAQPFFSFVQQLINDEGLDIRLTFYTDAASRQMLTQVIHDSIRHRITFRDYVPRQQVPHILSRASAALVLTEVEDADGPHGIMTTKFFEAIGAGTPVLCSRCTSGPLKELIDNTKAGITDSDPEAFLQYVRKLYQQWSATNTTQTDTDSNTACKFSRQQQALQLQQVIEQTIKLTNQR